MMTMRGAIHRPVGQAGQLAGYVRDQVAARPVRSGRGYLLTGPPTSRLVVPALADALESVFEQFARQVGAGPASPLAIMIARGYVPGSPGHGEGRAADIAAVAGRGLLDWKWDWDRAMALAERLAEPEQRAELYEAERRRNLGHGLYQALLHRGGWRVDEWGWRPYRGVEQLFGPWTATDGPWRALRIDEPNPLQQRRLADQRWVFAAHQDHIHAAR
jgi:hypothetical protein